MGLSTPTSLGSSARAAPPPLGLSLLLLLLTRQQEEEEQVGDAASRRTSSISSSCGAWRWRAPLSLLPQPPALQWLPLRPPGPCQRGRLGAAAADFSLVPCLRPACRPSRTARSSRRRRAAAAGRVTTTGLGLTGTPRTRSDEPQRCDRRWDPASAAGCPPTTCPLPTCPLRCPRQQTAAGD